MQVLNLLLKRRGVLKDAYKHSGEASHWYRLQEVDYLIRRIKDAEDRSNDSARLGERGHGVAPTCSDPSIVDYGRYKPSGAALGATLEGYASRPVDKEHGCAECGVSGGYALYCVACAEKYVSKGTRMTKDKALEMALKFIEHVNRDGWVLADFEPEMYACITAIKETLETKDEKKE